MRLKRVRKTLMRCKTLKESRKTLDINEEDKDDEKGEEHINDEDND